MMHGRYWDMSFGGGIIMVFFWILIILGIIFIVRRLGGGRCFQGGTGETPLDIVKKRYARGEIDKDEFERLKKDLSE